MTATLIARLSATKTIMRTSPTMDARLDEMIGLYAAKPSKSFANGGPGATALPWAGAAQNARDATFARFCVSVALRDYRFGVRGNACAANGVVDARVDDHAFVDGLDDRGLDGLALAYGETPLPGAVDPSDKKAVDAAIAQALAVVKANPGADLRILFVQAKNSTFVNASHVSLLGEAAQRFLTEPNYLSVPTKPDVAGLWRIYSAVRGFHQQTGRTFSTDVTLAYTFHGDWRNKPNVRSARNIQLTNLRNAMPAGRFAMDIIDCDDLLEGALHAGISITRVVDNVSALPLRELDGSSGYLCIIPGPAILAAFSRTGVNEGGAVTTALDDHFFLDNPRHYLGERALFNRGASALAASLRGGGQAQVIACHNGIVVTVREASYDPNSRKLSMITPQVVNGCQSTYTMQGCRDVLDGATFVVKVVRTESEKTKDLVILGSNTVEDLDEFDIMSRNRFIRDLEREFERHADNRLWLERRWRERTIWFDEAPTFHIPTNKILTPRQLMDGFAAAILGRPDHAHGEPQTLLRNVSRGWIFNPCHDPSLYRAVGWLVVAGRMWAEDAKIDWKDLPSERGGYGSRHQFVYALWRLADPTPDKTGAADIAKGREAQARFEALIATLADPKRRRALTEAAASVVDKAEAEARRQRREVKGCASRQWFTELVREEADKDRSTHARCA